MCLFTVCLLTVCLYSIFDFGVFVHRVFVYCVFVYSVFNRVIVQFVCIVLYRSFVVLVSNKNLGIAYTGH